MNDPENLSIAIERPAARYAVSIGSGLLDEAGAWSARALEGPCRVMVVSNEKVFGLYGSRVKKSLKKAGFDTHVFLMKDGERHKNLRSLQQLLAEMGGLRLARNDAVVALGGGVVGDLAGFAAAIHLRGVRFLQIPTTLLAMIDSSSGGKTGVNTGFGKNLLGAFHQPSGVLADVSTLATLHRRELTAGFCEAVKHAAISGRELFDSTAEFLAKYPPGKHFAGGETHGELAALIAANVAFKARIVAGDEHEDLARTDAASRKILNFGHTFAHALEKVTLYRRFKHGEAVGHGMLMAAALSKKLDILPENDLNSLNDVVHRSGRLPVLNGIGRRELLAAFSFDKKSVSDSLRFVLLAGIGKPVVISEQDIPRKALTDTLKNVLSE